MLIKFSHSIITPPPPKSVEIATCTWCSILLYVIKILLLVELKPFCFCFTANLYLFSSFICFTPAFHAMMLCWIYTQISAIRKLSISVGGGGGIFLCLMWIIKKRNLKKQNMKTPNLKIQWTFFSLPGIINGLFFWLSTNIFSFLRLRLKDKIFDYRKLRKFSFKVRSWRDLKNIRGRVNEYWDQTTNQTKIQCCRIMVMIMILREIIEQFPAGFSLQEHRKIIDHKKTKTFILFFRASATEINIKWILYSPRYLN